jgi:hypothetical protein
MGFGTKGITKLDYARRIAATLGTARLDTLIATLGEVEALHPAPTHK